MDSAAADAFLKQPSGPAPDDAPQPSFDSPPEVGTGIAAPASETQTATSLTPQTDAASGTSPLADRPGSNAEAFLLGRLANKRTLVGSERESKSKFVSETQKIAGDTPFDPNSDIGGWNRLMLSFRRAKDAQISFLQNKYGAENVQLDARGEPMVKVIDESTQKPKFIPVDADKISGNDFIDMIGAAPELAGSIIAMRKGGKLPGGIFKDLTLSALGAEGAGALKDIGVETFDSGSPDLKEIGKTRATMVPVDIAMGGAMALFGKAATKVITPFGDKPGPIQFDAMQARDYFKSKYGIDVPFSPGEQTGNSFLMRVESMMKKLPGASGKFADVKKEQEAAFRKIQDIALGKSTPGESIPSSEEVGEAAIGALESKVSPIAVAAERTRASAGQSASDAINDAVGKLTKPAPELYTSEVGAAIRKRVTADRDAFEDAAKNLYEKAKSIPGGRDRILEPTSLADDASKILNKELPAKDVIKEVPTGVLDSRGNMVTRTESGREILREFVPEKVVGKLKELASLKDQKLSLEDLIQMRNDVTNDIKIGESIPGAQTHFLGKIRDTLTKAIVESTEKIPGGELKAAWEQANAFYRDNVGKFHTGGIRGVLQPAESGAFVGDSEIVGRLLNGTSKANDLFRDVADFLGKDSAEFGMLKRSIADEVLAKSSVSGEKLIDGAAFLRNLEKLYSSNREIAEQVFGKNAGELVSLAKASEMAQNPNLKIDYESLKGLLGSARGGTVYGKFVEAAKAQQELDAVYRNKILKAIKDRNLSDNPIEPEEFVDRFLSDASQRETEQIVTSLHDQPELMQRIRQKTVQKLFFDSARKPSPTDPILLSQDQTRLPSTESLMQAIGDQASQKKLRTVLGEDTFRNVVEFAKAMKPGEATEQVFSTAGGLSAGMQVGAMLRGGDLAYLANFLKYRVGAELITNPAFQWWTKNRLLSGPDQHAVVNAIIASAPFITHMMQDFGEKGAAQAITEAKRSVDKSISKDAATAANPKADKWGEFLKSKRDVISP